MEAEALDALRTKAAEAQASLHLERDGQGRDGVLAGDVACLGQGEDGGQGGRGGVGGGVPHRLVVEHMHRCAIDKGRRHDPRAKALADYRGRLETAPLTVMLSQ